VEFREWKPEYERVVREMGFSMEEDERSARLLESLLPQAEDPTPALDRILKGREVLVVGAGPRTLPLPRPRADQATIAADGATTYCLEAGFVPDIIVTDLDGNLPDEVSANARGAFALLHAHGDNQPALLTWVPRFRAPMGGSVTGAPRGNLANYGGFTDGDRSLYLAEACGATRALLARFDLGAGPSPEGELRSRKLAVARRLIDGLVERGNLPVEILTERGRSPWPVRNP
jgi:uncharacterized Rossmann fold enzyme